MLHDNAVAQYIQEELQNDALRNGVTKLGRHCTIGEKILKNIPFHNDVSNVILYPPHENADGSEPFGKQWNEVPFFARIIHMCDTIDIFCRSMKSDSDEWKRTEEFVIKSKDKLFDSFCVEVFFNAFLDEKIHMIDNETLDTICNNAEEHLREYKRSMFNNERKQL